MKTFLTAAALAASLGGATAAQAEIIGVSMASVGDTFLTVLKDRIESQAEEIGGIELRSVETNNDGDTQLAQLKAFINSNVDAVVFHVVDEDIGKTLSDMAADADLPIIFVNRPPKNVDSMPAKQSFVASAEHDAGRLQAEEICAVLKETGKQDGATALLLRGPDDHAGAVGRSEAVKTVLATDECDFIKIVAEDVADWDRAKAQEFVAAQIESGVSVDAVFANNDSMALGAIDALKAAGVSMDEVLVGGVDATQGALMSMSAGDMDVTVFQNAAGQGENALLNALDLAAGKAVPSLTFVPFELVTLDNMGMYFGAN
ncbi:monosaccharide ABC transporter substrate-binding protein (CUT2 family) [Pacificibacter maritimus]|uniref:Monosaccharide ABC transporter substrate-binding protein (CUT2 family) n=1 Tax=Pacificibacter maritimus TaxID=762213 RepID=A0A3N4UJA3_9RHOB|nr:substrate-binding domain-containing protein [Pacificibacter maritimus]RPE67349.1 monosaccharide ABC transporter substrate-binding protein (CUT2 family) [Pacificibacter maritimus]